MNRNARVVVAAGDVRKKLLRGLDDLRIDFADVHDLELRMLPRLTQHAAVAAAGYTPGEKKMGADHAYQAWLTDPDGVRIELHEYTPDCCQKTGRTCYL